MIGSSAERQPRFRTEGGGFGFTHASKYGRGRAKPARFSASTQYGSRRSPTKRYSAPPRRSRRKNSGAQNSISASASSSDRQSQSPKLLDSGTVPARSRVTPSCETP